VLDDAAHPRVRGARRLHTASGRRRAGLFLVEGPQAVREALLCGAPVVDLFATPDWLASQPVLADRAARAPIRLTTVTDRVLRQIGETSTPAGVVAVCRDIRVGFDDVLASSPRLLAVLADVRDPGNAGTIIRTADAAGADAVLLLHGSVDPLGGKCVRSTVGSLFHLPVSSGHPPQVLDALRAAGLRVLAADGHADLDLDEAAAAGALDGPTAWVVGNEAWGLPADLLAGVDAAVRVPLYGRAESLNVAVAASLCLYASARVHRRRGRPAGAA
jgi:TrmH family RNA methyltransferase